MKYNTENYTAEEREVVAVLREASQHVRPEARHFSAILEKIPAKQKQASPFLSLFWKVLPATAIALFIIGAVGYSTLNNSYTASENIVVSEETTGTSSISPSFLLQQIQETLNQEVSQEKTVAYADNSGEYVAGDTEDVTQITDAYNAYEF